jgi:hypothetical protein
MSFKPTTTTKITEAAVNQKRNEREKAKNNNKISIKQSPAVWILPRMLPNSRIISSQSSNSLTLNNCIFHHISKFNLPNKT